MLLTTKSLILYIIIKSQWRAVTSEVGHAIGLQYFTDKTKKLSEFLGQRTIFVPKS